jgi:hypothetical protein
MNTRLFKYPCSYLIHSPLFTELPGPMLDYLCDRLRAILRNGEGFEHLTKKDRIAIGEILDQTGPTWWREKKK